MERPWQSIVASLALCLAVLWHGWRIWTIQQLPLEAAAQTSDLLLSTVYGIWYFLLLVGFLRVQAWARALFLYGTPQLFAIEVAVQLIEYDPLPTDLRAFFVAWLLLALALAPRRVALAFD